MKSVDYSDKAVSMRIRQASQLRKLCLSLGRAGREAQKNGTLAKPKEPKNPR